MIFYRFFFLMLVSLITVGNLQAQAVVFTVEEAEQQQISIKDLENRYADAVHIDPQKAVFSDSLQAFGQAYQNMMGDLRSYLLENGFEWEGRYKFYQRIYFKENGSIDYYLIDFLDNEPSTKRQNRFKALLQSFAASYQFPMVADTKFAQCAPITLVRNNQ